MMRPIDGDALKENCYKKMDELMESTSEHLPAEALSILCGFTLIDSAPTIEVTSVVRGEWIEQHENGHGFWVGVCSRCGEENLVDNYCPNCGAKMKGADDE